MFGLGETGVWVYDVHEGAYISCVHVWRFSFRDEVRFVLMLVARFRGQVISNIRQGYAGVDGEVLYGTMDADGARKHSGDIVFIDENETHYPE